jgi:hypothetical protein
VYIRGLECIHHPKKPQWHGLGSPVAPSGQVIGLAGRPLLGRPEGRAVPEPGFQASSGVRTQHVYCIWLVFIAAYVRGHVLAKRPKFRSTPPSHWLQPPHPGVLTKKLPIGMKSLNRLLTPSSSTSNRT